MPSSYRNLWHYTSYKFTHYGLQFLTKMVHFKLPLKVYISYLDSPAKVDKEK